METLELPIAEELDEVVTWSARPPVNFAEQEMDVAAFHLLGNLAMDQDAAESEER
jgi:hypothetical protein